MEPSLPTAVLFSVSLVFLVTLVALRSPWGVYQRKERIVATNLTASPAQEPFQEAWLHMIEKRLQDFPYITRRALYKSAWLAGATSLTIQITSDKRVYVTPPAGQTEVQRTGSTDHVPNVTFIVKYGDNCLWDFTNSIVISRLDYDAMQQPSPWDPWVGESKNTLDPGSSVMLPTYDIAPQLFWGQSKSTEDTVHCQGLSFPIYDWLLVDVVLDLRGELSVHRIQESPWEQRKQVLFWRGGLRPDSMPLPGAFQNINDSVRVRAVRTAAAHPDIMDIKLIGNASEEHMEPSLYGEAVAYEEQAKQYRYVLNMDGFGASSRLRTQMLSGSLIFKVDSPLMSHYMEGLKPWVHYVPVSWGNLGWDLPLKIKWAMSHDDAARQIALDVREFAMKRLNDNSTSWYGQAVIEAIAQREAASGEPFELIPGAAPFCCEHIGADSSGISFQWFETCKHFTAGWGHECSPDDPNPLIIAYGL